MDFLQKKFRKKSSVVAIGPYEQTPVLPFNEDSADQSPKKPQVIAVKETTFSVLVSDKSNTEEIKIRS